MWETQETQVPSPDWEDPLGVGNDNPLQYCLENSMDRGAWQATVHGVAESDMTERPSTHMTVYTGYTDDLAYTGRCYKYSIDLKYMGRRTQVLCKY